MIIKSILNNSALIALDEKSEDIILIGKGISFQKHTGDEVDTSKIEKIFKRNSEGADNFLELLESIPEVYFEITNVIVRHTMKKLDCSLDKMIYITLFDHVNSAIERYRDNIKLDFGMLHEIKVLYPEIYDIALWSVDYLNATFDISLEEDEAGFIAIHIIQALQNDIRIANVKKTMKIVKSVSEIFSREFKTHPIDGMSYARFMTHLKYFAIRYMNHDQIKEHDDIQFKIPEHMIARTASCIDYINGMMKKNYGDDLTDYEKKYLILHFSRMLKN